MPMLLSLLLPDWLTIIPRTALRLAIVIHSFALHHTSTSLCILPLSTLVAGLGLCASWCWWLNTLRFKMFVSFEHSLWSCCFLFGRNNWNDAITLRHTCVWASSTIKMAKSNLFYLPKIDTIAISISNAEISLSNLVFHFPFNLNAWKCIHAHMWFILAWQCSFFARKTVQNKCTSKEIMFKSHRMFLPHRLGFVDSFDTSLFCSAKTLRANCCNSSVQTKRNKVSSKFFSFLTG